MKLEEGRQGQARQGKVFGGTCLDLNSAFPNDIKTRTTGDKRRRAKAEFFLISSRVKCRLATTLFDVVRVRSTHEHVCYRLTTDKQTC